MISPEVGRAEFEEAWPRIVRALASFTRSLDVAEELAAEAVARAAAQDKPVEHLATWCITVGKRAWLDEVRRREVHDRHAPELVRSDSATSLDAMTTPELDDRLALLFVACDEALPPSAQMVLAMRVVCGLSISQVADHLGIQETAAAARLTRAKRALADARGAFVIPDEAVRRTRLPVVLACVAGMFTVAHRQVLDPEDALEDLGRQALSIADALVAEYPQDTEVRGLRAVVRLGLARRPGRLDADGTALALDEVDRSRWNRGLVEAGLDDATAAAAGDGRFALEAAISALHTVAPNLEATDWTQICVLYAALEERWNSPSVRVAHLVARSQEALVGGRPDDLLAIEQELDALESEAPSYASRDASLALADLAWRTGRTEEAAARYRDLAEVMRSEPVRRFCLRRAARTS
ncbi:DUF6596 domain-containing protein [Luteipulveratus mongoliensis]|uniref:Uncharacterized protein n=1 Tax=Luteipulveratus mongoliensis TaxID=571913 RepID=A0A0K1JNH8_9MICO|nr:DUF6596 domain-containing protein [Luteipulveratus mongoliensis]AKU18145.1 hypothetical protein VV02_23600 [Luteipulveratus mongoliensis]